MPLDLGMTSFQKSFWRQSLPDRPELGAFKGSWAAPLDPYVCASTRSVTKSNQTFHGSMDWSPPGSSVHVIFQARILEWVITSSSRDLPDPRIEPVSPIPLPTDLFHFALFSGYVSFF